MIMGKGGDGHSASVPRHTVGGGFERIFRQRRGSCCAAPTRSASRVRRIAAMEGDSSGAGGTVGPVGCDSWALDSSDESDTLEMGIPESRPQAATSSASARSRTRSRGPRPTPTPAPTASSAAAYSNAEFEMQAPPPPMPHASTRLPEPVFQPGTEWWSRILWQAYATDRMEKKTFRALKKFVHESFCSGTMMDSFEPRPCSWTGSP